MGRNPGNSRQRDEDQAAPPDVRAVLRRRADDDPLFFDAIRYARKVGYNSVQAATNGIEFAKSKEYCKKAFEAGLRYAYLQFDGIGTTRTATARSATCLT